VVIIIIKQHLLGNYRQPYCGCVCEAPLLQISWL
jgi:hypothetical protein